MSATPDEKRFRTLRGALSGKESEEENYFAYRASLRIFGEIVDLEEVTRGLGVTPTYSHRRGERRKPGSPPHQHDMWRYTPPVPETEVLGIHIDALWNTFRDRKAYILELKRSLAVDVFLGYRSNCDHAGIEVGYKSLEIFTELQVPFGLSTILT